jgi:hypothetical protein
MATISTSQSFDASARTAGETFTINSGAVFTIDVDTRYHKNAPASGLGSVSSFTMTAATGGTVLIDGTKVWLLPYTGGGANVPALGTIIDGGTSGAYGELMNISSSISAAPTPAGSASPVTGYIKLKSKTGTFIAGEDLRIPGPTKICSAGGAGARGFIEIVMDDAAGFTIGRAQKFKITGDWYVSETTCSGSRQQQVQLPNYGGTNCFYPGVWIETSINDVYEFWPACLAGTGSPWATTALGTDARSRFVQCLAGGIIRIGGDGTNSIGDLPAAGRKIRIPNVLLKSCATGSRASDSVPNATLATRPDFTTTNAGQIDIDKAIGHWQVNSGQAFSVKLKYLALFDQYTITECASALDLLECHNGNYTIAGDVAALVLTSNFAGGTVVDCKFGRAGTIASADYGVNVTYCNNLTFTRSHFQNRTFRTNAAAHPFYAAYCGGLIFNDCVVVGCSLYLLACTDSVINDLQYADSFHTTSSSTTPPVGVIQLINGTLNTMIDGFAWYTSVANVHPDTAIVYLSAAYGVKMRNMGTQASPLSAGSSNAMLYFCNDAGNSSNLEFKRIYFNLIATTFYNSVNSTKGVMIQNCAGNDTSAKSLVSAALNQDIRNLHCSSLAPASTASIYGSCFFHHFTSTSFGRLGLVFSEPTTEYASWVTTYFTTSATGTSGFNSSNGLALINSGDYAIFEFPYWIKGIDSFQNSAPTVTTATNMTSEYQIDTGAGWNGTWKTLNATNLSGETVDEVAGFRFKLRFTANATAAANLLTIAYALTNSNAAAQQVQYPLDTVTVTVTCKNAAGLALAGVNVRVETAVGGTLITQGTTDTNGVYSDPSVSYTNVAVKVVARKRGYVNNAAFDTISTTGMGTLFTMVADAAINLP